MRKSLQAHAFAVAVVAILLAVSGSLNAQPLTITHLAGPLGGPGRADGTGPAARFDYPSGVAVDGSGNVYIADSHNGTIRKITQSGVVSTLAAGFQVPQGVAVDGSGNVYVTDYKHAILKVTPAGVVSTLAGLAGSAGSADGAGSDARFNQPNGIAVHGSGNVYVADTYNHTIRRITPSGVVSTLAGLAGSQGAADGIGSAARFSFPLNVSVDDPGNLYVADSCTLRKVTPDGAVSTVAGLAGSYGSADGTGSTARFNQLNGVAVDGSGNSYLADTYNHTIRKVSASGAVTTLAGLSRVSGSEDGGQSAARFNLPSGVAVDGSGNIYVADSGNNTVRAISPSGEVSTLAGLAGCGGSTDGTGSAARFASPSGVAVDGWGNVYVANTSGHTIRKVTASGVVSTLAGKAGSCDSADGTGSAARFCSPMGVAVDGSGNVYVADWGASIIRKVTPAGAVSTVAGLAGNPGSADGVGSAARFSHPWGVAVDRSGNIYVASGTTIRKITPDGVVSTLAGQAGTAGSADGTGSAARFLGPAGVAVDDSGNVYVADNSNFTIRKVSPEGVVSTLAGQARSYGSADGTGSAARFGAPKGVAVDGSGNVYVADTLNETIRKVTPAGVVSTIAGLARLSGTDDGTGYLARFFDPEGIAVDGAGNVYVADTSNHAIRKGTPANFSGLVPIVLDVVGLAHYTSELQLTNLGASSATVTLSYTGSIGAGSGDMEETIPAGQQVVYPDAISYLRSKGVPIPTSGNQGGALLLSTPAAGVHVTVRTSAETVAPQPVGRAGLAYTDSDPAAAVSAATRFVFGLRTNDADRSNLAVYNMGAGPVSLKITLVSGDDGRNFEVTAGTPLLLPAHGWYQYGDANLLRKAGFASGYAIVNRVSGTGPFGSYGVVNDQLTNDGSFIPAQSGTQSGSQVTIPVLVEAGTFESELILQNRGSVTTTFALRYVESLSPAKGTGGTTTVDVPAYRQMIIPRAIDFLRSKGISIGARGEANYAGSLQVQPGRVGLENVFAGARTSSFSPVGGQFGLFYPAIDSSQEASDSAFILGLKADVNNRSNVAVLHTGADGSGPITLEFQVLDGSDGGRAVGPPLSLNLNPGEWAQPPGFFASGGVPNGYVRIRRTAGTAPWYAYGVINDGGNPGERTGDGAYVPMVK